MSGMPWEFRAAAHPPGRPSVCIPCALGRRCARGARIECV